MRRPDDKSILKYVFSCRCAAGFTLVEVVVALVIMLLAVTGILSSFISAKRYVGRAKRRIIAVNFIRQKINELKPSVDHSTWTDSINPLYISDETGHILPGDFGFKWGGKRSYVVTAGSPSTYRPVKVEVTWSEPKQP